MNQHDVDELVDIVDEQDRVIKTVWRSQAYAEKLKYTRIVLAFIVNRHDRLAILRRTPEKAVAPNALALVGGGVQSGETYLQACKREIQEEALFEVRDHQIKELGYLNPFSDSMCFFKTIYEVKVDHDTISFNPADFSELLWLTPQEVLARHDHDVLANGLAHLIKSYYL